MVWGAFPPKPCPMPQLGMSVAFPLESLTLLTFALLISASGFIRLVYFVSVGYAFSITGMALLAAWLFSPYLTPLALAHLSLIAFYGLRLGIFLVSRERSISYRAELDEVQRRNRQLSLFKRVGIWVGVSLLYLAMFFPALARLTKLRDGQGDGLVGVTTTGLLIIALGLALEAWADAQKSAAKKTNPKTFCQTGLFRLVRHPNYLGEITFWTGSFIASLSALVQHHPLAFVPSVLGLLCIILIMMGSTKRLETKQSARYGKDPAFQTYCRKVPVLFPFIPLYSLKKIKVYLE